MSSVGVRRGPSRLVRGVRWVVVVAILGTLSGCGRSGRAAGGASTVAVTVDNFKIDAPEVIHAGLVRLVVTGGGPSMHELNVARTDLAPGDLPVVADGTVDDRRPQPRFSHVAEVEGIDIGQRKSLTVALDPGLYVLYCNMDGHYMAGMSTRVRVTT